MKEIGAFEAKNRLGQLLDWVEAGEEVVITRRGKVVARMLPPSRNTRSL
jgi:prevent-host-death family protein